MLLLTLAVNGLDEIIKMGTPQGDANANAKETDVENQQELLKDKDKDQDLEQGVGALTSSAMASPRSASEQSATPPTEEQLQQALSGEEEEG